MTYRTFLLTMNRQNDLDSFEVKMEGDLDAVQALLDGYFAELPQDTSAFDRALTRRDVARIASMAHRINRTASELGLADTARAASRVKECCQLGFSNQLELEVEHLNQIQHEAWRAWKTRCENSNEPQ